MGDEHDGLAELGLQPEELVLQLGAHDRVDRAERLVHQHHRRVGGQRPGDADPLLLAAGQLRRVALGERWPADRPGRAAPSRAGAGRALVLAEQQRDGGDVVDDGAVREQPGVLDDVADARGAAGPAATVAVSRSSSQIRPQVGSIIRLIIRRQVVLPQPDGPTNTVIWPDGASQIEIVDGDRAVRIPLGDRLEPDHAWDDGLPSGTRAADASAARAITLRTSSVAQTTDNTHLHRRL